MKIFLLFALLALLVLCLLPILRNSEREQLPGSAAIKAPGQMISLSSGKVHYQLEGQPEAPIVVLVHGFSIPSYTWDKNVSFLLEQDYRVLRYDLYGRGYSARPDTNYDRSLFVGQLNELLQALDIQEPVSLVGLSMGGAIAAAFAADHPAKVRNLVLLAPFNGPIDIGPLAWPGIGDYLAYAFYAPGMPGKVLKDFVNPEAYPDWPGRFKEQMKYAGFSRAILATARGFIQSDPMADFRQVGLSNPRTLLLWGDADATLPPEQAPKVQAALGDNVQFELIGNAGHALHVERADQVNAQLAAFLNADRYTQ